MVDGMVKVGTAEAAPGSSVNGVLPVATLAGGTSLDIPVTVINGARAGRCLWINGGIHGDEPEGALMCQLLRRKVDPAKLEGALVLVPAINLPAFQAARRGNPLDTFSHDMNRLYPGRQDGYFSERVAHTHYRAMIEVADLELSIHSGGEHSYLSETIFAGPDPASQELARAMGEGWSLVLTANRPTGSPMAAMLDAGKTGITVELGGRSATSPRAFHRVGRTLADAALNVLRHYRMMDGEAHYASPRYHGHQQALLAPASGLYLPEPDFEFQKPMRAGDRIATIHDLWGEPLAELTAPVDGLVFGLRALPNVTVGDWCCFYGIVEGTIPD